MSGTSIGMIVLVLVVASQFGLFYYAMNKGLYFGQPKGEGFAPGWAVRCPKCNRTVDAGKAGLIRVGAKGNSRRYGWCDGCKSKAWLCVEPDPGVDEESPTRLVIRCTGCDKTADARAVGLIRLGDTKDSLQSGPCSRCQKTVMLSIEQGEVPTHESEISATAHT